MIHNSQVWWSLSFKMLHDIFTRRFWKIEAKQTESCENTTGVVRLALNMSARSPYIALKTDKDGGFILVTKADTEKESLQLLSYARIKDKWNPAEFAQTPINIYILCSNLVKPMSVFSRAPQLFRLKTLTGIMCQLTADPNSACKPILSQELSAAVGWRLDDLSFLVYPSCKRLCKTHEPSIL